MKIAIIVLLFSLCALSHADILNVPLSVVPSNGNCESQAVGVRTAVASALSCAAAILATANGGKANTTLSPVASGDYVHGALCVYNNTAGRTVYMFGTKTDNNASGLASVVCPDNSVLITASALLRLRFTVTGVCVNGLTGSPIAGCYISFSSYFATTGSDGSYTITGVTNGTYTGTVSSPGYYNATINVVATANVVVSVTLYPTVTASAGYIITTLCRQNITLVTNVSSLTCALSPILSCDCGGSVIISQPNGTCAPASILIPNLSNCTLSGAILVTVQPIHVSIDGIVTVTLVLSGGVVYQFSRSTADFALTKWVVLSINALLQVTVLNTCY